MVKKNKRFLIEVFAGIIIITVIPSVTENRITPTSVLDALKLMDLKWKFNNNHISQCNENSVSEIVPLVRNSIIYKNYRQNNNKS